MPRIRTIKPEFWDSPGTARASLRGRLFFIAMWNWADDYGIGTANARQLIGFAFPNDADVSDADFPRLCTEVSDCFGVVFYEVSGRPFYAIPSWENHQKNERRAKSRNPPPDQGKPTTHGTSVQTRGSSGTGTGEPRNRVIGEFQTQVQTTTYVSNARDEKSSSSSEFADGTPIPDDPEPEVPTAIETGSRRSKPQPTDSARQLVREIVGTADFDRDYRDRLAVQVDKLARAGRSPELIREVLREWLARSDVRTPEGLSSVANDVAKRSRGRPSSAGTVSQSVDGWLEISADADQFAPNTHKELT